MESANKNVLIALEVSNAVVYQAIDQKAMASIVQVRYANIAFFLANKFKDKI